MFKKSDFEQVYYSFIFVNQTSGTEFVEHKRIRIEEIWTNGIKLIVPTNTCNLNHSLMLLFFKGHNPKIPKKIPNEGIGKGIHFSAIGKITNKDICELDNKYSIISLNFIQFDKYGWEDIIEEYSNKQEEINNTFKKMQFYEE